MYMYVCIVSKHIITNRNAHNYSHDIPIHCNTCTNTYKIVQQSK